MAKAQGKSKTSKAKKKTVKKTAAKQTETVVEVTVTPEPQAKAKPRSAGSLDLNSAIERQQRFLRGVKAYREQQQKAFAERFPRKT